MEKDRSKKRHRDKDKDIRRKGGEKSRGGKRTERREKGTDKK